LHALPLALPFKHIFNLLKGSKAQAQLVNPLLLVVRLPRTSNGFTMTYDDLRLAIVTPRVGPRYIDMTLSDNGRMTGNGQTIATYLDRLLGRRFTRGTPAYEAVEIIATQLRYYGQALEVRRPDLKPIR
jgi:hypothetical protein